MTPIVYLTPERRLQLIKQRHQHYLRQRQQMDWLLKRAGELADEPDGVEELPDLGEQE